ncbi:hemin uptake protein HemP [Variovorax ginsengisoli]|uniref:Hemin uptake protein HemP n=1 Tax=Variovorax ginsengisoli TaxID=363844 RepID=A0ABT9SD16_9BURK|nr:hemin uptake protein HemP [Variovorax ginsengisoli]MDP9902248.1 hemin uptake protein HemP [Variovorax ginsengisoli]
MQTLTLNPSLSGTRFRRAPSAASAKPGPANAPAQATTSAVGVDVGSLDSAALLQGRPAVEIAHNGFVYRLQATRLGKLILTK